MTSNEFITLSAGVAKEVKQGKETKTQERDIIARVTGYAHDLVWASDVLARIQTLTQTDAREYTDASTKAKDLLVNVSAPEWVFVAVGFRAHAGNVGFPVLAQNKVTGDWVWSRNLIWDEKNNGLVWSGGNYCYEDEAEARQCFKDECDGIVYHTEAF